MTAVLPPGYRLRPPTWDDLRAVHAFQTVCDTADYGAPDTTEDDLRTYWSSHSLEEHIALVTDAEDRVAGYTELWDWSHGRLIEFATVHPEHRGRGIGTYLCALSEERARQRIAAAPEGVRVTLTSRIVSTNEAASQLLVANGYTQVRSTWNMEIELDAPPPVPQWPAGIALRPFRPGVDDRAAFETIEEAFADHWGHTPTPYEMWLRWMVQRADFDPTLWFVAMDGDAIAGAALCKSEATMGWVDDLGVRRAYRRRGLALALLYHAFGEFYRRGERRVGLSVDTQNLTGATRLYERAGMRAIRRSDRYEKELRPGVDLSVQALA